MHDDNLPRALELLCALMVAAGVVALIVWGHTHTPTARKFKAPEIHNRGYGKAPAHHRSILGKATAS